MDFIDKLQDISIRITKMKDQVITEEATKNAFIMPFLSTLGYDVFNPLEVVPEFTADIGTKKGEKVDYCILKDEQPVIIIECKHWKESLDIHSSQLHRYFHVTSSRFAILTNGIEYKFFSDLEESNKMDSKAFFEFSMEAINENIANELKKFQKGTFDIEKILDNASDLKYTKAIRELLSIEFKKPSEDFIKYFASRVYNGKITKRILGQFEYLVQKSVKQLLSDMVSERLKTALSKEEEDVMESIQEVEENQINENQIQTTEEELEAYRIIQAIVRKVIPLDRISMRDKKSYCSVLLDNNNRKPICRFWFNGGKNYISFFDSDKNEEKHHIESLEAIYSYETKLLETIGCYE